MNGLWQVDVALFRLINVGWQQAWLDPIFRALSFSGSEVQPVALILLLLYPPTRRIAALCSASYLAAGAVGILIKEGVNRERPSNFLFAHPLENVFGMTSFPSGHTTTSFAIAISVWLLVRHTPAKWVGMLAVIYASLVGLSRIYVGVHYPTDVVGGAILGSLGAYLCHTVGVHRGWIAPAPIDIHSDHHVTD